MGNLPFDVKVICFPFILFFSPSSKQLQDQYCYIILLLVYGKLNSCFIMYAG